LILPDFILSSRVNQCWQYSGIDSPDQCLDKSHFKQYPHSISYRYNSRGFRDQEWPESIEELKNAIWCIGDSFTVGLGSPIEHTWPWLLQKQTGRRVINVSMDGASNNWIARRTAVLQKEIAPKNTVIMWSYLHRREHEDCGLNDESRRIHVAPTSEFEDAINLKNCINMIKGYPTVQLIIPFAIPEYSTILNFQSAWDNIRGPDWPLLAPTTPDELLLLPKFVQNELTENFKLWTELEQFVEIQRIKLEWSIIQVNRLDRARDGHHFDLVTAQWVVDQITTQLNHANCQ
jgi:hypothetical protein